MNIDSIKDGIVIDHITAGKGMELYRLLKLDPQTQADLALVRKLAQQLGHPPGRREVPAEVRMRLQKACGSWSNALFQLGLQEKRGRLRQR